MPSEDQLQSEVDSCGFDVNKDNKSMASWRCGRWVVQDMKIKRAGEDGLFE
jgi:hypothetical protein